MFDRKLSETALYLAGAGEALAELGDTDPALARLLGLEVASLEARLLMGTGAARRVAQLGMAARAEDLGRLERLETLVRLASSNVDEHLARMESEARERPWKSIAGAVSLAGGLVSIARQLW